MQSSSFSKKTGLGFGEEYGVQTGAGVGLMQTIKSGFIKYWWIMYRCVIRNLEDWPSLVYGTGLENQQI